MYISIIICTWNRCASLAQTLSSLSLINVPKNCVLETLIVDNNSSDGTRNIVEQWAISWPLGALLYKFESRQGKQFALNTGVEISRGELLAFTDDDILFSDNWLQVAAELFEDSNVDLAGGRTLIDWPSSGAPAWYQEDMLAILGGVDLGVDQLNPAPSNYVPGGGNMFVRRSLFQRVGLFDERMYRHMDHEFGTRSQASGALVVYDPRLTVRAPVDPACLTKRYFQRWSFKAGFARSEGTTAVHNRWPTVPLWIYRQFAEDWIATRFGSKSGKSESPQFFARELRMWRAWGTIANDWHAILSPSNHEQWVRKHSQKQANLY